MKALPMLVLALVLAGCKVASNDADALSNADTLAKAPPLTRHQRDSVIGASKLPGARAVRRASDVSEAADARTQTLEHADSSID